MLAVQRSLPSVSDRHIYLHTLAQTRPPMLQDYSPHAKALGNYLGGNINFDVCNNYYHRSDTVAVSFQSSITVLSIKL